MNRQARCLYSFSGHKFWCGLGISANFYFSLKISVSYWQMRFLSQVELRISAFSQLFSPQSQVVSHVFRGLYVVRTYSFCSSPSNFVAGGGLKSLCDLNPDRQRHFIFGDLWGLAGTNRLDRKRLLDLFAQGLRRSSITDHCGYAHDSLLALRKKLSATAFFPINSARQDTATSRARAQLCSVPFSGDEKLLPAG